MEYPQSTIGTITLCIGPMWSSKTEWIIDRASAFTAAGVAICVLKPAMDDRYSSKRVVSHSGRSVDAIPLDNLQTVLEVVGESRIVFIDEGQFFMDLAQGCLKLSRAGKHVIVAALAATAEQAPWPSVSELVARADQIIHKVHPMCSICHDGPAPHTRVKLDRVGSKDGTIKIGGAETYETVCRVCLANKKN